MGTQGSTAFDPVEVTERFFTVVKSLSEFEKAEIPSREALLLRCVLPNV